MKYVNDDDHRKLRLRADGRNIADQQLPTLLDVTCCVRLHTLLHVVACCCTKFETGQTFQPTTPNISFVLWLPKCNATMLDPFALLFQHCWGNARSLRVVFKDLWVVSFPWCTAGHNIMLGVVAAICTPLPTRTQQLPTLLMQQCWELLCPFARSLIHTNCSLKQGSLIRVFHPIVPPPTKIFPQSHNTFPFVGLSIYRKHTSVLNS